jgi:hypothetical protein
MATFDSGRQRYSMNFYASHQRPLQRRSYTGRPSRPAEGQPKGQGPKVSFGTNLVWLGRIEARTGLRMMPTFPRSPLSVGSETGAPV